ncbi:hypothetical protein AUJ68_03990 [Candidatus Woesearchaeota archaeon CG1_02_57_44]|nr:MAG: hypothetical protein AUJ68_03990 [Candidatus Woesearchaeota archaeon CG1_02_57_44]
MAMEPVKDIAIAKDTNIRELLRQFRNTGFQAHHIAVAADIVQKMHEDKDCAIVMSFPCNLVASGLRGVMRQLVEQGIVKVLVTTSGTVDEDFIRSKSTYLQGEFEADDEQLGKDGINRMGNVFVPNDRYELLETEMPAILDAIAKERPRITPSKLLEEIGKRCPEGSLLKAAADKNVPIYCPGITDGAFGMQLFLFQQKRPDFVVDPVADLKQAVSNSFGFKRMGLIALGGGIAKHHAILSSLMRGGFDYAVYVNSSSPYRGSLSGATTSEAMSWGKVKPGNAVTVHGDAQIVLPLLAAMVLE